MKVLVEKKAEGLLLTPTQEWTAEVYEAQDFKKQFALILPLYVVYHRKKNPLSSGV